ncbi:MAG TPA: tRNA 4-thiouridine(8) synthase ThiI [Candidatus Bathyarchaeota archaeon]|nr:tRNA 4-thiouridine(8) synthase ThiI [Candidatus Bathyarchaeota archaeon]
MLGILRTVLVAYGEISLKSPPVRRRLERILARQIASMLRRRGLGEHRVYGGYGRLYVEDAGREEAEAVAEVFGVVSAMPAYKTSAELESIIDLAVKVAEERIGDGDSFAVRPKVVGEHPYTSSDVAIKVGDAVLQRLSHRGVHVDLDNPTVTLYIEVRDRDAYIYTEVIEGFGGLPYGTQGRLVSLLSGGIDSPVAMWMMMKRGVEVYPLFIDQRPYVGEDYVERAIDAFRVLSRYIPEDSELYAAPFGEVMKRIMESPIPRLRCLLCKRSMYRVASAFAEAIEARGLITGESLGQVASQTLDNLYILDEASSLPVLRPLIGLDKVEIEHLAMRIGTYEVTAKAVHGCTVVPDKPATKANLEVVRELEEELGLPDLCSKAAEEIYSLL